MRPVNLIPPEQRRGERAPTRTGPAPYAIVGALAVAVIAVTLIAKTNNQISDRKAEKVSLESQVAAAQAEAQRLRSFADFASLQQAREATVASLAQSRFDWERVLRELAIVIPSDVWLTNLDATASADSGSSSSTSSTSTSTVDTAGPSLDISGCAAGHEGVARFLVALRDIDGLTRATVVSSDKATSTSASAGDALSPTSSSGTASQGCSERSFVSTFEIQAAFDNAVPLTTAEGMTSTTTTSVPTTTTPASTTPTSAPPSSGSSPDAAQTSAPELQQQKDSAAENTSKAKNATGTFLPGTGSAP
jgi:Tfp pilus assembly protein PilN